MNQPVSELLLLVEDNDDHAELAEFYINNHDASIIIRRLRDGAEALDYLRAVESGTQAMPWLVLLDLKLPKYNGHEILARIKGDKRLASIPVVIFSTSASPQDIEQAFALHANSYIIKPMEGDGYERLMSRLLEYWNIDRHHLLIPARPHDA